MKILVTGGAGYVGSIVTEELIYKGYEVIVFDNLIQGHEDAVTKGATLVIGNICNSHDLDELFSSYQIDAVMHMAAETVVEYSVTDPKRHFESNIGGGINLLHAMLEHNILRLVFSSSAAVYGDACNAPIEEDNLMKPINAYGESKLAFEHIIDWYGKAYGLQHISLRYFNAAGASEHLGEDHHPETHLIPNILKAATEDKPVCIFGIDYPTKDGTCIRDYVHVRDIAQAHILALERMDKLAGDVYNLGNNRGYSVKDVVGAINKVVRTDIPLKIEPRRSGDPAILLACSSLARAKLGWKPQITKIEDIVESAWLWLKKHPYGYAN